MRAVLYADGVVEILDAAPGAAGSSADDLNDAGQLVGSPGVGGMHRVHGAGRAFLYDSGTGTTTDIGTLPGYDNSYAAAINNAGQVVGSAWLPDSEADLIRRAFLYDHRTGVISDLNDLIPQGTGWDLMDAFDISDVGQIVGQGLIDGEMHGFVLTPVR
jgi:probable HAF family extracellular repeat protein